MIFPLFDSTADRYGEFGKYIFLTVICLFAVYFTFWLCDLLFSLFCRMFDKTQKISVNPIKTFSPLYNAASGLMFLLFGCCWKSQTETSIYKKGQLVAASVLTLFCNTLFALLFFICGSLLMTLSEASYYTFVIYPFVVLFKALFMVNVSVFIFSFCPLPQFMLGNIIHILLPEKSGEKFNRLGQYSFFLLIIAAAFFSRGEGVNNFYTFAATKAADFWNMIL